MPANSLNVCTTFSWTWGADFRFKTCTNKFWNYVKSEAFIKRVYAECLNLALHLECLIILHTQGCKFVLIQGADWTAGITNNLTSTGATFILNCNGIKPFQIQNEFPPHVKWCSRTWGINCSHDIRFLLACNANNIGIQAKCKQERLKVSLTTSHLKQQANWGNHPEPKIPSLKKKKQKGQNAHAVGGVDTASDKKLKNQCSDHEWSALSLLNFSSERKVLAKVVARIVWLNPCNF